MTLDTLIHNAILPTCNPSFDIIHAGWVGIRDSRIEAMMILSGTTTCCDGC